MGKASAVAAPPAWGGAAGHQIKAGCGWWQCCHLGADPPSGRGAAACRRAPRAPVARPRGDTRRSLGRIWCRLAARERVRAPRPTGDRTTCPAFGEDAELRGVGPRRCRSHVGHHRRYQNPPRQRDCAAGVDLRFARHHRGGWARVCGARRHLLGARHAGPQPRARFRKARHARQYPIRCAPVRRRFCGGDECAAPGHRRKLGCPDRGAVRRRPPGNATRACGPLCHDPTLNRLGRGHQRRVRPIRNRTPPRTCPLRARTHRERCRSAAPSARLSNPASARDRCAARPARPGECGGGVWRHCGAKGRCRDRPGHPRDSGDPSNPDHVACSAHRRTARSRSASGRAGRGRGHRRDRGASGRVPPRGRSRSYRGRAGIRVHSRVACRSGADGSLIGGGPPHRCQRGARPDHD